MKNKRLLVILAVIAVLLLIPFIGMQISEDVDWSLDDFTIAAVLLLSTGLLCELAMRTIKNKVNRIIACGVLLLILFFVWAELAVGVFGTPFAGS